MDWQMIGVFVAVVVNLIGVAWMLRDSLAKEREKTDEKIKLSEKTMKDDFVCKNVCKILHEVAERDTSRLEKKVDSLSEKIEVGMSNLLRMLEKKG